MTAKEHVFAWKRVCPNVSVCVTVKSERTCECVLGCWYGCVCKCACSYLRLPFLVKKCPVVKQCHDGGRE